MLLHTTKDTFGTINVEFSSGKYVDLLFKEDPTAVQSRLNIHTPDVPELEYIQALGLGLALVPKPQKILVIGHGGGSVAKYYTKYCPEANIDIVDIRPKLFEVSKKYFLYTPSANTRFYTSDALVFLERVAKSNTKYDLILLDVFIDGPSNIISEGSLWSNLAAILSPLGFLSTNVWRFNKHEETYADVVSYSSVLFNTTARTDLLSNQCIIHSSHLDPAVLDTKHVLDRVELEELRTQVPLSRILRNTRVMRKSL